jgi:hypothetical protein
VRDLGHYPIGVRVATALVAYPSYRRERALAADLSVYYPHPHGFATWKIAGGARSWSARAPACSPPCGARPLSPSAGAGSSAGCCR